MRIYGGDSLAIARGRLPEDYPIVSPMIAALLADRRQAMPFKNMCDLAGVDLQEVYDLMHGVAERELYFISVGYGGIMINTLYFLALLAKESGYKGTMFRRTGIYDPDTLDITNLYRLYPDLSQVSCEGGRKVGVAYSMHDHSQGNPLGGVDVRACRFSKADIPSQEGREAVIVGAPDFQTREDLVGTPFLFMGHAGNELQIYKTPRVDTELTRETYGSVDTTIFLYNVLLGTVELLRTLACGADRTAADDTAIATINFAEMVNTKDEKC
ncbi:MAG: hypothetical protein U9Q38_06400 [Thermodesulfobacteriota bacterium]|nr:hypothetical protein [Thermodesulfobacteriota bacterium]